ncbi:MAG: pyridoxine 5'-phosphate synthase [Elusimicrobiota bacterium]|jgi:pyridoxine 5-phosphate synthase|nr:pyridoxine 5'-phosphate synthase [Elusimicrobiota bacterium]
MTPCLGLNIDHIATLRQARGINAPDPVQAAKTALTLGVDYIVLHIRRDRRHVQEHDLQRLCAINRKIVHLEMANTKEMCEMALKYAPGSVCIVPEYPNELTTSGGLKIDAKTENSLRALTGKLKRAGIKVSLFIDAKPDDVRKAKKIGADIVELCTKDYSEAKNASLRAKLLEELSMCSILAKELGIRVHSGHGLNLENAADVAAIDGMECLNIGFSIIARAVFTGLPHAILEMREAMK